MGLFTDDDEDALSGDNHKSIGTRFGTKFDPLNWLFKAFGSDAYEKFINKTGDKANELSYKAAKPFVDLSKKYDPIRKGIEKEIPELGEAHDWVNNKPASTAGLLFGGGAGYSGLSGALSGGAAAEGGAAAGAAGGAPAASGGGAAAGGGATAGTSGGSAASTGGGFNWQGLMKGFGGSLQQQGQQKDEMAMQLAQQGPPPPIQSPGIGQNLAGQQYAELLKRAKEQPPPNMGGQLPPSGGLNFA